MTLTLLMESWARRQRWQAEMQANVLMSALAKALGGEQATGRGRGQAANTSAGRVSPDTLLGSMGVKL